MAFLKIRKELKESREIIDFLESELAHYKELAGIAQKNNLEPCVSPLCETCMYSVKCIADRPRYYFNALGMQLPQIQLFCSINIQCNGFERK